MKYFLIFLLLLVIVVLSLTLGAQNNQLVRFNFLLVQGEYRISTLLASLFGGGFIIGWLLCGLFWLRDRLRLARAGRRIKYLEQQLTLHTSAPSADRN